MTNLSQTAESVGLTMERDGEEFVFRRGEFEIFRSSFAIAAVWLEGYRSALERGPAEDALLNECADLEHKILSLNATPEEEERYRQVKKRLPPRWDVIQSLRAIEIKIKNA